MLYNNNGQQIDDGYNNLGQSIGSAYDARGATIWSKGEQPSQPPSAEPTTDYERAVMSAYNAAIAEGANPSVVPLIIHTDQHGELGKQQAKDLFAYLGRLVDWSKVSCIGLGDVSNYSPSGFAAMAQCLSPIPRARQINIWGNHDTWGGTRQLLYNGEPYPTYSTKVLTDEEFDIMCQYFDNSAYNGHHKYNRYGLEYMVDEAHKIKYVCIGGWEYDGQLGGHSRYNISKTSLQYIVEMLSAEDDYDIVVLSHVALVTGLGKCKYPPVEGGSQGGNGSIDYNAGRGVMTRSDSAWNAMLMARKNKGKGTVYDSYGNAVPYDFSRCTSRLICNFGGHEHCDKYEWTDVNFLTYLFDAFAYDAHPFYFCNIDRDSERLHLWKVDMQNRVFDYTIPLIQP